MWVVYTLVNGKAVLLMSDPSKLSILEGKNGNFVIEKAHIPSYPAVLSSDSFNGIGIYTIGGKGELSTLELFNTEMMSDGYR